MVFLGKNNNKNFTLQMWHIYCYFNIGELGLGSFRRRNLMEQPVRTKKSIGTGLMVVGLFFFVLAFLSRIEPGNSYFGERIPRELHWYSQLPSLFGNGC